MTEGITKEKLMKEENMDWEKKGWVILRSRAGKQVRAAENWKDGSMVNCQRISVALSVLSLSFDLSNSICPTSYNLFVHNRVSEQEEGTHSCSLMSNFLCPLILYMCLISFPTLSSRWLFKIFTTFSVDDPATILQHSQVPIDIKLRNIRRNILGALSYNALNTQF